MDQLETLRILSHAADWDAAAPSPNIEYDSRERSSAERPEFFDGSHKATAAIRQDAAYNICRVKRLGGGSVPILKVLLSNACAYNCAYCVNRRSASTRRAAFKPEELARTIDDFRSRTIISGAFFLREFLALLMTQWSASFGPQNSCASNMTITTISTSK